MKFVKKLYIIKVKGDNVCVIIIFVLSHSDHPNHAEFARTDQNCKISLHHMIHKKMLMQNVEIQ